MRILNTFLRRYLYLVPKLYIFSIYWGIKEGHRNFKGQLKYFNNLKKHERVCQEAWDDSFTA